MANPSHVLPECHLSLLLCDCFLWRGGILLNLLSSDFCLREGLVIPSCFPVLSRLIVLRKRLFCHSQALRRYMPAPGLQPRHGSAPLPGAVFPLCACVLLLSVTDTWRYTVSHASAHPGQDLPPGLSHPMLLCHWQD